MARSVIHAVTACAAVDRRRARRRRRRPRRRSVRVASGSRFGPMLRSAVTPAAVGSTRNTVEVPSPVRAGTRMRAARWRGRARGAWCPRCVQPSPSAVGRGGGHRRAAGRRRPRTSAAVRTTSPAITPGSSAACCSSVPNSAIGRAPSTSVAQQRHGRHRAADLLEHAGPARRSRSPPPPCGLGQAEAEQVGLGQLGPGVGGEPVAAGLDLAEPLRRAAARRGSGRRGRAIAVCSS